MKPALVSGGTVVGTAIGQGEKAVFVACIFQCGDAAKSVMRRAVDECFGLSGPVNCGASETSATDHFHIRRGRLANAESAETNDNPTSDIETHENSIVDIKEKS